MHAMTSPRGADAIAAHVRSVAEPAGTDGALHPGATGTFTIRSARQQANVPTEEGTTTLHREGADPIVGRPNPVHRLSDPLRQSSALRRRKLTIGRP